MSDRLDRFQDFNVSLTAHHLYVGAFAMPANHHIHGSVGNSKIFDCDCVKMVWKSGIRESNRSFGRPNRNSQSSPQKQENASGCPRLWCACHRSEEHTSEFQSHSFISYAV